MATGWPRNQQDLRWPDSEDADTSPGGRSDRGKADRGQGHRGRAGRDAGFLDGEFGADHPSGPLPVSPAVQPRERGRLGRGKSRAGRGPASGDVADADYDWIRYIGEAGPAQEAQKPPSTAREDAELAAGSRDNTGADSGRAADSGRRGIRAARPILVAAVGGCCHAGMLLRLNRMPGLIRRSRVARPDPLAGRGRQCRPVRPGWAARALRRRHRLQSATPSGTVPEPGARRSRQPIRSRMICCLAGHGRAALGPMICYQANRGPALPGPARLRPASRNRGHQRQRGRSQVSPGLALERRGQVLGLLSPGRPRPSPAVSGRRPPAAPVCIETDPSQAVRAGQYPNRAVGRRRPRRQETACQTPRGRADRVRSRPMQPGRPL